MTDYHLKSMIARELITDIIPPLLHTDTGETALRWMEEFKVEHLPVLKNGKYVGLVSEDIILDKMHIEDTLDKLFEHLPTLYVRANAHVYEVLYVLATQKVSVIPILDENETYLGCTDIFRIMKFIAGIGGIREEGGIIVLEMNQVDYSLAQIAQIVESNDAKILNMYLTGSPDSTKIEVTIKINQVELDRIIRTFERYEYKINATFQKGLFEDDLKLRYEELMKYLNS